MTDQTTYIVADISDDEVSAQIQDAYKLVSDGQSNMKTFQYTTTTDDDEFTVPIPSPVMADTNYGVFAGISYIPPGGAFALPYAADADKLTNAFVLRFSGTVKTGTVVTISIGVLA